LGDVDEVRADVEKVPRVDPELGEGSVWGPLKKEVLLREKEK